MKLILSKQTSYANSFRLLIIIPLRMFVEMHNLLLFLSFTKRNLGKIPNIITKATCTACRPMNYQNKIPRTERRCIEFFLRIWQFVNEAKNCFNIGSRSGLKDVFSANCGCTSINSLTKITLVQLMGLRLWTLRGHGTNMVNRLVGVVLSVIDDIQQQQQQQR